jgi:protein tyrosine phosphatase
VSYIEALPQKAREETLACHLDISNENLFSFVVDHSRVKLTLKTPSQDSDYINANFIKVRMKMKEGFLATLHAFP